MKQTLPASTIWERLSPLVISLFLFLQWYYYRWSSVDTSIVDVEDYLIGQLMSYNVDVNERLSFYFSQLSIGVLIVVAFQLFYRNFQKPSLGSYWKFLGIIGGIGCFSFLFIPYTESTAGIQFSLVVFIAAVLKALIHYLFPRGLAMVRFIYLGAIAFIASVGLAMTMDRVVYLMDYLGVFWCLLVILDHFLKPSLTQVLGAGFLITIMFTAICLVAEYQLVKSFGVANPHWVIVKIILLLFIFWQGTRWWTRYLFDQKKLRQEAIVLFGLLCCIVFVANYTPTINLPDDQFELANVANSYMRFFQFGEWPFVDFISSHMLYDQLPSYLYGWVNGYTPDLGFLSYSFIYAWIIYACLFWYFSYHYNKVYWVFIFLLLFPFFKASLGYSPILISVILLHKSIVRLRFKDFFTLGGFCFFLFFWKLDIGVGNLMMVVLTLCVYMYRKATRTHWIALAKAVVSWLLISVVLLIVLSLIFGGSYLMTQLQLLWDYIGAHTAHGLPDITYRLDRLYYFHYLVLPVLTLAITAYTLITLSDRKLDLSIVALSIFYFANFQRGLVRHSLTSYTDNYLSSFGIFILVLFISRVAREKHAFCVMALGLALIIPLTEYSEVKGQKAILQKVTNRLQSKEYLRSSIKTSRVNADQSLPYQELKDFLDTHYALESSYIDLSNHPMSYFYTQRRPPSYFNQYLQNTVTQKQQEINVNRLANLDIPVVIYRSAIPEWLDETDGIPNQLRYKHITAYIHKHYTPYQIIDGKWIWLRKDDPLLVDKERYNILYKNNLGHIPGILAKQEEKQSFSTILKMDSLQNSYVLPIAEDNLYLEWATNQGPIGEHRVEIYRNDSLFADFLFRSDAQRYQKYLLPLSWMVDLDLRTAQDSFRLSYTDTEVKEVQILRKEQ